MSHLVIRRYLGLFLFTVAFPKESRPSPLANRIGQRYAQDQTPAIPLFYFSDGKQAENMIVRSSGEILVTIDTAPELYQIDPFANQTGGIVHSFPNYTSLFGIVELINDVFYIIASNFTGPPNYYGFEGTASILELDLREAPDPLVFQTGLKVTKIVDVPEAQLLDGLAIISQSKGLLMSGDAQTGTLYLINVLNHTTTAVLQDELLSGINQEATAGLAHIGVNGLKYHNGILYWSNTARGIYGQVPINSDTGHATAKPSVLANDATDIDDLSFDASGDQFISEDERGILLRPAGTSAAKNRTRLLTSLPGADANAFGRTLRDKCVLYAVFAGEPSGVASIDLGKQGFCG
ncbi:MAG: hypothetical protein Q9157_006946 [Trypethelium eluteriae]